MHPKNFLAASLLPPLALALWMLLGGGVAHAADDDKRLVQARDAMRRAQQALQQTQAERAALQRDKTALESEREQLAKSLADAQAGQRSATLAQSRLSGSLAGIEAERDRLKTELDAQRQARALGERDNQALQARLAAAQQALGDQRRVTAATSALLERSVQALADNEAKNRELHALAVQAVDAYANDTPVAMRARDEPFLGLGRVALENRAEELRRAIAAQKLGR